MNIIIEKKDDAYSISVKSKNSCSIFNGISKEDLESLKKQIDSAITEDTKVHSLVWNPRMRRLVSDDE